jgi:hypothetical protein
MACPSPARALSLGARATVPPHVVYRRFAAETVVLNLETGTYHGLNATGTRMLELLESSADIGEATRRFAESHGRDPAEVEPDVAAFCERLRSRGLIEIAVDAGR